MSAIEHQPDAAAVEEDRLAEAVLPCQPRRVPAERFGAIGIDDMRRNLADGGHGRAAGWEGALSRGLFVGGRGR